MPVRDFAQLQIDLERTLLILKGTKDPKRRRELLMEMRRLLANVDRLSLEKAD
jgi:hypothetical protein